MTSVKDLPFVVFCLYRRFTGLVAHKITELLTRYRPLTDMEKERYLQFMLDNNLGLYDLTSSFLELCQLRVGNYAWCNECDWVIGDPDKHDMMHRCIERRLFHKAKPGRWGNWCACEEPRHYFQFSQRFSNRIYCGPWTPECELEAHMLGCTRAVDALTMTQEAFDKKHREVLDYNTRLFNGDTPEDIRDDQLCALNATVLLELQDRNTKTLHRIHRYQKKMKRNTTQYRKKIRTRRQRSRQRR